MFAALQARLIAAGAIALAVLGAVFAIFRAGARSEQTKQTHEALDAVKQHEEVRNEVDGLSPDAARERLRHWSR